MTPPLKLGWLCALLLTQIAIYAPGLHGPFVFDDFGSIVQNEAIHITELSLETLETAALSSETGPLKRPISLFTFAINYYFSGLDTWSYKAFNLALHMFNTLLVFWLASLLVRAHPHNTQNERTVFYIALAGAALWGLHPLNLTSVLYVVQRMTSLATFFMLLAIICYLSGRLRQMQRKTPHQARWLVILAGIFTLTGAFCKENALLAPGICLLVECLFFRFQAHTKIDKCLIWAFNGPVLSGGLGLVLYAAIFPDWLINGYELRNFTLTERMLTEPGILLRYLYLILIPNTTQMSLFHDDIVLSTGLFKPAATFFYIAFWIIAMVAAVLLRKRLPEFSLGVGWFLIGHSMESSVFALELMHEHRNYFPMIGPVYAAAFYLLNRFEQRKHKLLLILPVCLPLLFATATLVRAAHWSDWPKLVVSEVIKNPDSARSLHAAARWYFWQLESSPNPQADSSAYQLARDYLEKTHQADPTNVIGLLGLLRLHDLVGLPPEPAWVEETLHTIQKSPLTLQNFKSLVELIICNSRDICTMDPALLNQLITAATQNPTLSTKHAAILNHSAGIYTLQLGLLKPALYYFKHAIAYAPEAESFKLDLAQVYRLDNQQEKATALLNQINPARLDKKRQQLLEAIKQKTDPGSLPETQRHNDPAYFDPHH